MISFADPAHTFLLVFLLEIICSIQLFQINGNCAPWQQILRILVLLNERTFSLTMLGAPSTFEKVSAIIWIFFICSVCTGKISALQVGNELLPRTRLMKICIKKAFQLQTIQTSCNSALLPPPPKKQTKKTIIIIIINKNLNSRVREHVRNSYF